MREGQVVEIEAELITETPDAYCVSTGGSPFDDDGEEPQQYWLPKSKTEHTPKGGTQGCDLFVVPEWLAIEKGLV